MSTPAPAAAQKRFRDRAARLKRALASEKRRFGAYDDSSGRRYRIGPLYALAGDLKEALAHYRWFEKQFPDDVDEPVHCLWWALTLYRSGNLESANRKLLDMLVRNLYLLPALIGSPIARQDMWHASNRDEPEYLSRISPELLPQLSVDERSWIERQLETTLFRRVKDEYVSTHHALLTEENVTKRSAILRRWDKFRTKATASG